MTRLWCGGVRLLMQGLPCCSECTAPWRGTHTLWQLVVCLLSRRLGTIPRRETAPAKRGTFAHGMAVLLRSGWTTSALLSSAAARGDPASAIFRQPLLLRRGVPDAVFFEKSVLDLVLGVGTTLTPLPTKKRKMYLLFAEDGNISVESCFLTETLAKSSNATLFNGQPKIHCAKSPCDDYFWLALA